MGPTALAVVGMLVLALVIVRRLSGTDEALFGALRSRFLYGVPWGTLVTGTLVLGVYLFVQGGWDHWYFPVTIPFRAWSYFYPTGMVFSSFAHTGANHLIGNLVGTAVLAPIAEYAWGHYPPERTGRTRIEENLLGGATPARRPGEPSGPAGGASGTGGALRRVAGLLSGHGYLKRPAVRAFVIFPAAAIGLGLLNSLFGLGPVIGFSSVVFAFGGFALVHYPIATVVGVMATSTVRTVYRAITDPVVTASIQGSPPSPPWWAEIAVQGHALGVMLGVVLGLVVLFHRERRPDALRVFVAMGLYAVHRGLWAVYWYQGGGRFVLYRGVGVVLVTLLALLVVLAATAPDRPVSLPGRIRQRLRPGRLGLARLRSVDGRAAAISLLVIGTVAIAGPAIVPNLTTVGDDAVPGEDSVTVEGYTITYAEDVRNRLIPVIDLPYLADRTSVSTSGVIVVNEERGIWYRTVSKTRLAAAGWQRVRVGGVGWRETVLASRQGWSVAGNGSVYRVNLRRAGHEPVRAFESPPRTAAPRIANRTVTLGFENGTFALQVERDGRPVGIAPIPSPGNRTTVGGLRLVVEKQDETAVLFAERDGTRVRIAQRETYRDYLNE